MVLNVPGQLPRQNWMSLSHLKPSMSMENTPSTNTIKPNTSSLSTRLLSPTNLTLCTPLSPLTSAQQQSYHQMLLLQQKAARQAALLSELDAAKYEVISRQPDPTSSAFLGVKYDKYGNHLDLRALDVGNMARSPMSAVSDSYYTDVDHHTPRSYMLLEDAAELAKGSTGMSSSYSLAERELAKAEKLLRRSAADLGSTDYLGSTSRLHTYGKTPDEEDTMEEPYELKLLKQQLKQEFRRSTDNRGLETDYNYLGSTSASARASRLSQDEITFGLPNGHGPCLSGTLPPISADSRDQFGSCLSLEDSQQQQLIREEPTRGRGYVLMDDLQGTMSDSEALSDSLMALNRDDATNAYHLRREETDWFDKPRDGRSENGQEKRQGKGPYYPFPHLRVKLQRDPKDRSVSGNGLGIRVVGGKEVPASNGDIGAYVAKVLPGGAAEQTGKILEGMQVLEWNGVPLTGKTYEEVQGLVGQPCNEAELCVRLDLNMLSDSDGSDHLDFQEHSKGDRPPRSPGVDPKQLAAELQKVSQQQAPSSTSSSGLPPTTSATSSQPGSPSVSKKRHSSKTAEGMKTQSQPVSGEIQLQIHYDKQLGNLIVHVLQARNLAARDNNGYSDPFVKVYLLPGRG
ncbi:protein piccolo-like [Pseudochaenichthys georgianus]|uniref:protein piccolo-like n=1 Tax=Pseudochaenichthys georgianus TaxID=52239 RepID=UPI0039C380C2